jgi:hypothetical protein
VSELINSGGADSCFIYTNMPRVTAYIMVQQARRCTARASDLNSTTPDRFAKLD